MMFLFLIISSDFVGNDSCIADVVHNVIIIVSILFLHSRRAISFYVLMCTAQTQLYVSMQVDFISLRNNAMLFSFPTSRCQ